MLFDVGEDAAVTYNESYFLSVCSSLSKSLPYHLRSSYGVCPLDVNETLFFVFAGALAENAKPLEKYFSVRTQERRNLCSTGSRDRNLKITFSNWWLRKRTTHPHATILTHILRRSCS